MPSIAIVTSTNAVYNFDPVTNEVRYVYTLPTEMYDIDFDVDGNMYGLTNNGSLYSIDSMNGSIDYHSFLDSGANALEMFDAEGSPFGGFYAGVFNGEITQFGDTYNGVIAADYSTTSSGDIEGYNNQLFWSSTDGFLNEFNLETGALVNFWYMGRDDVYGLADDGTDLHLFAGKDHYVSDRTSQPVFDGSLSIGGIVNGAATLPIYQLSNANRDFGSTPFDDIVNGSGHANVIYGGHGNDILEGVGGNDIIRGDRGDDTIKGGDGDDQLRGGLGDDFITGDESPTTGGSDRLYGDRGDDVMFSGGGDDRGYGGSGDDSIFGEAGADTLIGDAGADTLAGGSENDRLYGGTGDDFLFGDGGADLLAGSNGADTFDGGTGNDRLFASRDGLEDIFVFNEDTGSDRIFIYEQGVDKIHIDSSFGFANAQQVVDTATVNSIGTVHLNLGGGNAVQIYRYDFYNPGSTVADLVDDILIV